MSRDIAQWPQVCRVIVRKNGIIWIGSGVYVGDGKHMPVVLTVWHNMREAPNQPVQVQFPATGFTTTVKQRSVDPDHDIASLRLAEPPPKIKPAKLAESDTQIGKTLTVVGFNHGQQFMALAAGVADRTGDVIEAATIVPPGFSGGPMLTEQGEVCAIIRTTGRRTCQGIFGGWLRRLLLWPLHNRPGIIIPKRSQTPPVPQHPSSQFKSSHAPHPAQNKPLEPPPAEKKPQQSVLVPSDAGSAAGSPPQTTAPRHRRLLEGAANIVPTPGVGWWTALAGMLGIGGPVGLGIGLAGWLISRRLKERLAGEPRKAGGGPARYRQYAKSLADNYHNNGGRDKLWDEHLGRIFDEETKKLANQAEDDTLRRVLQDLRERVERNVSRIFTKGAERTISLN